MADCIVCVCSLNQNLLVVTRSTFYNRTIRVITTLQKLIFLHHIAPSSGVNKELWLPSSSSTESSRVDDTLKSMRVHFSRAGFNTCWITKRFCLLLHNPVSPEIIPLVIGLDHKISNIHYKLSLSFQTLHLLIIAASTVT